MKNFDHWWVIEFFSRRSYGSFPKFGLFIYSIFSLLSFTRVECFLYSITGWLCWWRWSCLSRRKKIRIETNWFRCWNESTTNAWHWLHFMWKPQSRNVHPPNRIDSYRWPTTANRPDEYRSRLELDFNPHSEWAIISQGISVASGLSGTIDPYKTVCRLIWLIWLTFIYGAIIKNLISTSNDPYENPNKMRKRQ